MNTSKITLNTIAHYERLPQEYQNDINNLIKLLADTVNAKNKPSHDVGFQFLKNVETFKTRVNWKLQEWDNLDNNPNYQYKEIID